MNQHLIEMLENQWKKDPGSRVFLRLAEEYRKSGRFGEAIGVCQAGLVHQPHYLPGLVCLGRCQLASHLLNEAEATLLQANRQDQDNIPVLQGLVEVYEKKGDAIKAVPFLERMLLWDSNEEIQEHLDRILQKHKSPPVEPQKPKEPVVKKTDYEDYHHNSFSYQAIKPTAEPEPIVEQQPPEVPVPPQAEEDPLAEFHALMDEAHAGTLGTHSGSDEDQTSAAEQLPEAFDGSAQFDSVLMAQLYQQQGHFEEAREMLSRLKVHDEEPEADLHSQLEKMDSILQNETKNAKKIRLLSHWLRTIKESHHVS